MNGERCSTPFLPLQVIAKKVLCDVHKYTDVNFKDSSRFVGDFSEVNDGVFRGSMESSQKRIDLNGIVGKATPAWASISGATAPKLAADLALVEHVVATKQWGLIDNHWLSSLLKHGSLLVRPVGANDDSWVFSLGDVHGVCGLGWPAVRTVDHGRVYFIPSTKVLNVHWLHLLNPDTYEAMVFQWASPTHVLFDVPAAQRSQLDAEGWKGLFSMSVKGFPSFALHSREVLRVVSFSSQAKEGGSRPGVKSRICMHMVDLPSCTCSLLAFASLPLCRPHRLTVLS
jgi:hypothetical protein